jgi:hypothetical protein
MRMAEFSRAAIKQGLIFTHHTPTHRNSRYQGK